MYDELRVDHHTERSDRVIDLLFCVPIWVRENGMYLAENLDEIFAFLLVALELSERVLDLVDNTLDLEHLLDLGQVLILLGLCGLLVFIVLLL